MPKQFELLKMRSLTSYSRIVLVAILLTAFLRIPTSRAQMGKHETIIIALILSHYTYHVTFQLYRHAEIPMPHQRMATY